MNLTKPVRKVNLKRWKAQGPAVIDSPLQAIHNAYPDLRDEKGNPAGKHPMYAKAYHASRKGDGSTVKQMARALPA